MTPERIIEKAKECGFHMYPGKNDRFHIFAQAVIAEELATLEAKLREERRKALEEVAEWYGQIGYLLPKLEVSDAIRAQLAAVTAERDGLLNKSSMDDYREFCIDGEAEDPIERLRFFCSIAMSGQDWLDSEPFFDAVTAERDKLLAEKENRASSLADPLHGWQPLWSIPLADQGKQLVEPFRQDTRNEALDQAAAIVERQDVDPAFKLRMASAIRSLKEELPNPQKL